MHQVREQSTQPTYPWRVSSRVQFFLSGSGIWAGEDYSRSRPELSAAGHRLVAKIKAAPDRKDGSCTVKLDPAEATVLIEYAETMAAVSRDNAGPDDPDATADLNAARALCRQEHKLPADAVFKVER